MATKYDTNPLDPDFPEKAKAAAASGATTNALPENRFATADFPPSFDTEEQTRKFGEQDVSAYSSPYNGQYIPRLPYSSVCRYEQIVFAKGRKGWFA